MTESGIQFEMTINLGNVLTIVAGAVAFVFAWARLENKNTMLDFRVGLVEKALEGIATILKTFTRQETEIAVLKTEIAALTVQAATNAAAIEQLRVGEGFIQSPRRGNIDGEYKRDK